MKLPYYLLVLLLTGAACTQSSSVATPDANLLLSNDFEASAGWNDVQEGSLTIDKAHSGRWSIQVNAETPFSYTYIRPLDKLDPKLSRQYAIQGWALRASTSSNASLVVQVNKSRTDTTKVFYASLNLGNAVKSFNQWEKISLPCILPADAAGENIVKIYLWNDKSTAPTYLDDLQMTIAAAK